MRIIVAITGATGTVLGIRTLQMLKDAGVETHLVMSKWGARTLLHETPHTVQYVKSLATVVYGDSDQGAAISSGSFVTDGMIVAPCSVRTLAAIAHGHGDNLIHRAADAGLLYESPDHRRHRQPGCHARSRSVWSACGRCRPMGANGNDERYA